ncbi:PadR family transcriptional regulator [Raineyella sp.]|uniref:Transcription regulator PadR N-terminal domain-containing protein n=1 Tax=bioreactor metagenome TaxID=1076179 RepID=A0A644YYD0_9ZZZZ|nr:PadR family transcriptional regulator [Raineyella sp.]MEA5153184.1 PadR family transcriptional regulator [Raineyella sp.]
MRADHLTQLRKGALELAVLALLDRAPSYGFEIVEGLAGLSGLEATTGTIYPLLTRLKNSGLVGTTWRESPKGPPRKYYTLSDAGRTELADQAAAWRQVVAAMDTLLREESR